eukprot:g2833.t1
METAFLNGVSAYDTKFMYPLVSTPISSLPTSNVSSTPGSPNGERSPANHSPRSSLSSPVSLHTRKSPRSDKKGRPVSIQTHFVPAEEIPQEHLIELEMLVKDDPEAALREYDLYSHEHLWEIEKLVKEPCPIPPSVMHHLLELQSPRLAIPSKKDSLSLSEIMNARYL